LAEGISAYAVLSLNNSLLTFLCDNKKEARNGLSIGPFGYDDERWSGHAIDIKTVVFDDSFLDCTVIKSTTFGLNGCEKFEIIKVSPLVMRDDLNMYGMFLSFCREGL